MSRRPRLSRPPLDPRLATLEASVFAQIEKRRHHRTLQRHILTLQIFSIAAAFAVGMLFGEASALNSVWGW